jgi:Uncharacterized conserved protein
MNRREAILYSTAAGLTFTLRAQSKSVPFTGTSGRPAPPERQFHSAAVERTIVEMRLAIGSGELAGLFENCFPNTLDTTVFPGSVAGKPDTFVITGDIPAMWLRDSAAQMWPYVPFAAQDADLRELIVGVINRHTRLIQIDPYANSFTRNISDPPLKWAIHDKTEMRPGVGERKWEIDSLCYPIRLAHGFWKATGSREAFDESWIKSAQLIVATFREQQRVGGPGPYHFERSSTKPSETLESGGYGNPIKPNGLICSGFRPSDDACTYPFFIPSNLFAVQTLEHIAEISATVYNDTTFTDSCLEFANEVRMAVRQHGIVKHPKLGEILAYEVDGFGNTLSMDDANAPGLLSLAYLDLLPIEDPLYLRTRAFALSDDNPYFFHGKAGEGIGGPHIGKDYIWPMSILIRALTSRSDMEIVECLQTLCTTTAGTYFMHEAYFKDDPEKYTRPWFAWANGLLGELLLKLRAERPALLRSFRVKNSPSIERDMHA